MIHTSTAVDNFYITHEESKNTPSRLKNVDEEVEFLQKVYGAALIRSACLLLRSPPSVVVTAQTLLQRFYCKKSLTEYDVKLVATASITLSCKLEEKDRKLRDVLNCVRRAVQRQENRPRSMLAINTPEYEEFKSDAQRMEMIMLREFGFFGHVSPPHPFAYALATHLELDDDIIRRAWALCNDSAMTMVCVRFKPAIIACGCIFLAAKEMSKELPNNPPWWRLVDGATKKVLETVAKSILALHQVKEIKYVDLSNHGETKDERARGASRDKERNQSRRRSRSRSRSHDADEHGRRVRRRDSRDFDKSRYRK